MPQNFYELVWIFIIYAFIGWCTEVSYAALDRGIFVNRGFLNGPYCPIYGCGVVIVVAVLTPLKDSLLILFAGSFLLTSVLEYITGFILEKVFHNKWWDYSNKPFNLQGYVCLKFSIYWGLACTFIMDVLHPIIYKGITMIPHVFGVVLLCIIMTAFVVDCGVTVSTILKFNKRLKVMDEMAAKIHKLSDEIGENIYENVTTAVEKSEEFQETHEELLTKLSDTKENIMELPVNAKEKLSEAAGETKLRLSESTETAKAKFAESATTTKEKLAETTETAKVRLAESAATTKEKLAETTETAKAKLAESAATTKEKFAESTETTKERLAESTESAKEKLAAYKESREAARLEKQREKEELERKYKELFAQKNFGFKRLMKAFPDMTSKEQNESLEKYKKYFNIRKSSEEKKQRE